MDLARLRYMANQIARNFEAIGHDEAAAATADHIFRFWDPRMKAAILADGPDGLDPVAAAAVARLAARGAPGSQTPATAKDGSASREGGSDAG